MILTDDILMKAADETCCGYFVVLIPQYNFWQGYYIDRTYVQAAEMLIRWEFAEGRIQKTPEVPERFVQSLVAGVLVSRPDGPPDNRQEALKMPEIGVLGAVVRNWLKADYFWVNAAVDVPKEFISGNVHKLNFNREPNVSLRVGREALFKVPEITAVRIKNVS